MDLLLEMFFTAIVAFFFSYLVAKLVSMAMAGDSDSSLRTDFDGSMVMEELFDQKRRAEGPGTSKGVSVVESAVGKVDRLRKESAPFSGLQEPVETSNEVRDGEGKPMKAFGGEDVSIAALPADTQKGTMVERRDGAPSDDKKESLERFEVEERCKYGDDSRTGDPQVVRVMECETGEQRRGSNIELEIQDDDWVGIEKSELEKSFATASKFVEEIGDRLPEIDDDVRMELYGLHKIATEGACRESPPMALMIFERANWHAWQKLGYMNPDEAMERYLSILSTKIPGWAQKVSGIETVEKNTPETSPTESCSYLDAFTRIKGELFNLLVEFVE